MKNLFIVMGVSGCGKSTAANFIASQFDIPWIEADDYHSEEAKKKMASGIPLTDFDREPWLERLFQAIRHVNSDLVLSYSGLREAHRRRFLQLGFSTHFIHLEGNFETIKHRLNQRKNHFVTAELLKSQFEQLDTIKADEPVTTFIISDPHLLTRIETLVTSKQQLRTTK